MKALLLAIVLDSLIGDPNYRLHPIRLMGALISRLEKWLYPPQGERRQLRRGIVLVLTCLAVVALLVGAIQYILSTWLADYGWLVEGVLLSQLLATRSLYAEGAKIKKVLATGDLDDARRKIGYLVSRQTEDLTVRDIYQAAVETLTENTTDAIVAPLFYYCLFGLSGIALYKMVNTLDSMIGYHNERYEYFGKFAARLDDVANFIPARLAAGFIIITALLLRGDVVSAGRCFIEQRNLHNSVNAGCTEAALAGALDIKLSGPTKYFGKLKKRPYIGYGTSDIGERQLGKTMQYVVVVAVLTYLVTLAVRLL